jgi:hypothetical protein
LEKSSSFGKDGICFFAFERIALTFASSFGVAGYEGFKLVISLAGVPGDVRAQDTSFAVPIHKLHRMTLVFVNTQGDFSMRDGRSNMPELVSDNPSMYLFVDESSRFWMRWRRSRTSGSSFIVDLESPTFI